MTIACKITVDCRRHWFFECSAVSSSAQKMFADSWIVLLKKSLMFYEPFHAQASLTVYCAASARLWLKLFLTDKKSAETHKRNNCMLCHINSGCRSEWKMFNWNLKEFAIRHRVASPSCLRKKVSKFIASRSVASHGNALSDEPSILNDTYLSTIKHTRPSSIGRNFIVFFSFNCSQNFRQISANRK